MKTYTNKTFNCFKKLVLFVTVILLSGSFYSCKDDYLYDNQEPEWLGNSIYEYLQEDGNFKTTLKLIQDIKNDSDKSGYEEVLKLTGSKTLFVAKDDAYVEFFKNNPWGVTKYEDLTLSQKKSLLKFSMLNNAYTIVKLSNYNYDGVLVEETAMRQETALDPIDILSYEKGDQLPTSQSWNNYRDKGIYLLKDNTPKTIVYYTEEFMNKAGLTSEDFSTLTNGKTRDRGDLYVFDKKVIQPNVRCKNGYIHVLESVLTPPQNMAEYIQSNPSTKIFSKLLDRFCVMLYDEANTELYKRLNPGFNDSIFVKTFYASNGGISYRLDANHREIISPTALVKNLLPYNPGWNGYRAGALEADMAAMFVPTDEAMNNYFNSGIGAILKNRFGSWDNVPDEIILPFIKRHMRTSLLESVPSRFSKMVDAENYALPVQKGHIVSSFMASNGNVFVTNEVYPPVDYISVYSPVLLSSNSKIMNWAINISQQSVDGTMFAFYKLYLNSLVSKYSLFIPTDDYFKKYIDPVAYGQDVSGVLKYWYNEKTSSVNATVYKYDKINDVIGDSVDVITSKSFLQNRLWDLLDSHIVVGDVESGKNYYVTKANDIIQVSGSGNSLVVKGGNDIVKVRANVTNVFRQYNGTTFFIDRQIQPALRSVYKVLSENPNFSMFFDLLNGVPEQNIVQIFAQQGVDYRIKFFNAFRYTVFVPTNEAIQKAIDNKVINTWQEISSLPGPERDAAVAKLINFLKYHFQDEAVFFGDSYNGKYQSATLKADNTQTHFGTVKNKYYKLGVTGNSGSMTITMDTPTGTATRTAHVVTSNGLYNIIAKDYIFAKLPSAYKYVDGTGSVTGALFNTSSISTSASAVIHQIDNVLTFE